MDEMRERMWIEAFCSTERVTGIGHRAAFADKALREFDQRFRKPVERDNRAKHHPDHYIDDDIPF